MIDRLPLGFRSVWPRILLEDFLWQTWNLHKEWAELENFYFISFVKMFFLIFVWPSSKASFTTSVQRVLFLLTVAFSSWQVLFVTVTGRAGRSTGRWWQSRRLPQLWTVPGTLVRRRLCAQNWHQALVWPPQSEVYNNFYSVL